LKYIRHILLYPFSILYGFIVFIRNKLFDWKIFSSISFETPTICVGNLTVGGVGKTPHVEYLIRLLSHTHNIATLSRGYKRKTKGFIKANKDTTHIDIGDEPLQYHLKFPKIQVNVDEDRVHGIKQIEKSNDNINVILLDDAYQHRSVKAGLNILITEYNDLYINDSILPSGRLRESKRGSSRANIIIVSKTPEKLSQSEMKTISKDLSYKSYQSLFFSYVKYTEIIPFTKNIVQYNNKTSVLLLTGIVNPIPLLNHLKKQFNCVDHLEFSDHHNYTLQDINTINSTFNNIKNENKLIITTEKDLMRLSLPEISKNLQNLPLYYIPIKICFHESEKNNFDSQIIKYVTTN